MTLDDIEAMTAATISPAQAASVIGCNEQALRIQARERPEWLGFPVIRINNQIKIRQKTDNSAHNEWPPHGHQYTQNRSRLT